MEAIRISIEILNYRRFFYLFNKVYSLQAWLQSVVSDVSPNDDLCLFFSQLLTPAIAEPALTMSSGALLALKHAIEAAREDAGHTGYFALGKS